LIITITKNDQRENEMELRHLTTFRTVAQLLSFRRAAESLGYVQANVTAHIQALEEEIGVQLFDRLGRHVVLTDAGKQLLEYADKLLALAQEAQMVLSDHDAVRGTLTIGAPETLCIYRLPALLYLFQSRFPQIQLLFRPLPCQELRRSVSEGSIDCAFVMEQLVQGRGLMVESLVAEPIVLLAAPFHALVHASRIEPTDLELETLLLTEVGCSYRAVFEHQLATAGIVPKTTLEFSSIEAIKQCVMLGMGVAVLPAVSVVTELAQERLVVLPWQTSDFQMLTQIIWSKGKWLSPSMQAFLTVTREVFKDNTGDR
jgi:DNA-binding transcriptional LysR family regulator